MSERLLELMSEAQRRSQREEPFCVDGLADRMAALRREAVEREARGEREPEPDYRPIAINPFWPKNHRELAQRINEARARLAEWSAGSL